MTNPDALARVVARVEAELEDWDTPGYDDANTPVRVGDLRSLLAALAEAQSERDQLREAVKKAVGDGYWREPRLLGYILDAIDDVFDARRTPQPETPE